MTWRLQPASGPYPGPWEGKDAVSWVWEIYRDDQTRRVLVEVSGTAMAMGDEYLPVETAQARATSGRSEVEKVVDLDDPPHRISLGSTGYLDSTPHQARPDFLIIDAQGRAAAAVEVRNPEVLTAPLAVVVRDRLAPPTRDPDGFRFLLVVSQNSGFLFDRQELQPHPVTEFSMFEVVQSYYPPATREQRFRGAELEIIVNQWLRDLVEGTEREGEAETALRDAEFLDTVLGGKVEVQPA